MSLQTLFFDSSHQVPMTLDDYIRHLQALRELMPGDTSIQKWLPSKGRHQAPIPTVAFAKTFPPFGSERRKAVGQFWHEFFDLPGEQGIRCIRV